MNRSGLGVRRNVAATAGGRGAPWRYNDAFRFRGPLWAAFQPGFRHAEFGLLLLTPTPLERVTYLFLLYELLLSPSAGARGLRASRGSHAIYSSRGRLLAAGGDGSVVITTLSRRTATPVLSCVRGLGAQGRGCRLPAPWHHRHPHVRPLNARRVNRELLHAGARIFSSIACPMVFTQYARGYHEGRAWDRVTSMSRARAPGKFELRPHRRARLPDHATLGEQFLLHDMAS